ncbi:MAG: PAS domain S-box protein [Anaeromyxobacteraceae bacterium]
MHRGILMTGATGAKGQGSDPGRGSARPWMEWAVLGGALLLLAVLLGLELHSSRKSIEGVQRARLHHQAKIVERMLGTRLRATVSALDTLRADAPGILSGPDGPSRMNDRLKVMVSSMVGVRTFLVVNEAGIAVASNREELIGGDWHEGERYRAIRAKPEWSMTFVSPPFMTPLGNWALSLGRVILDERGGFDGYVLAIIDPEYFQLLLDSTRYAPDMVAAMVHGGGKVIFRVPDPEGAVGKDLAADPGSPFGEHVRSGRRQTSTTSVDPTTGVEGLVVLQDLWPDGIPASGALVATFERDAAAAFAPWRQQRNQRLLLLAVVGAASTLGLFFRQRRRASLARIEAAHDAERRRQDEALRSSEQRYRGLLEMSPGAVFVNRGGRVEYVNRAALQVFGAEDPEQLLGKPAMELFPAEVRPQAQERVATLLAGGKVPLVRMAIQRLDGSKRVGQIVGSTFEDERGVAIQVVLYDVTEQVEQEKELRDSEAMLRAVFEGASDGILIGDPATGALHSCNASFAAMTGYTQEEVAHLHVPDLHLPEDLPRVREIFADVTSGRRPDSGDMPVRRKDGTVFRADVGTGLVVIEGRTMLTGFFRDMTERRKAEAELRASEERFRDVVASADEYVFEMDATGRLSFISEAVEKILGYRPEEMIGRNSLEFMTPEEQKRSAAHLAERVARSERIAHLPQEAVHRDGRTVRLDVSAVPVLAQGGALVGYRGAALDASLRHVAEEERAVLQAQLAQSQKLEGIGRLAGGIAHDFNNILSVILSCTGFVLEATKEDDPRREDLHEIEKGAHRAAALTRQLLAFSRRQVLQPVTLDLNQTLAEMEKMLRRIIGEDIDLVHVLAPDLGMVRADPGQVEQVIMNIAVNARDAMPEGGKLTIETADVDLDEEYAMRHPGSSPGPHVMLAITDSGQGMDGKTLARVFEPFFTTKGPGRGNGLGLSTVYGIVKQSGGSIYVYSEVGQGTTFKVYLPRDRSAGKPAVRVPAVVTGAVQGETILVVEDDEVMRDVTRRILEGAGYVVLTAASGPEGLATCDGHAGAIDLLLTDVVMPQMNGRVLAERLVEKRPGTRVIYMSGYTDNAIVHHGVLARGTHFIGKPFSQADLLARVREVLDVT